VRAPPAGDVAKCAHAAHRPPAIAELPKLGQGSLEQRVSGFQVILSEGHMSRLSSKGLLERRRGGKTDFYRPVFSRERYLDLRARAEVESLVDQFGDVALAHIARQMAQLDPQYRRSIQRLARKA
jgi:hypothetical protein